eukprot:m.103408 g.103408  ORF g.103408 m.103408 type:complete len:777 (+) comp13236_c0_seq2:467-2797(+)
MRNILPLLALLLVSVMPSGAQDLCYQVAWGAGSNYQRHIVRPVTAFPKEHALVKYGYCNRFSEGDAIPPTAYWKSYYGSCYRTDAANLFYAYYFPYRHSSNTGFEVPNTDLLYFVADSSGNVYFVVVHDKAEDGSGGQIKMEFLASDLIGKGVGVPVRDDQIAFTSDKSKCVNNRGDCYYFDSANMYGYFSHSWPSCCTDGFAIGKLPLSNWRFNFKYHLIKDINHFKVGNFNPDTNNMDFLSLDEDIVREFGFEVSAQQCADYCGDLSCSQCMASAECGWCSTGGCMSKKDTAKCSGSFQNDGCCASCAAYSDCNKCVQDSNCGWSYEHGKCLSATAEKGLCQSSTWYEFFYNGQGQCSPLPGAVLDKSSNSLPVQTAYNTRVTEWCSGHGYYNWGSSLLCTCHQGWAGYDCSIECPGHAEGSTCGGHGKCDKQGSCLCDCGYAGTDCSETAECECDLSASKCYIGLETGCAKHCGNVLGYSHCTGFDVKYLTTGADRRVSGSDCVCADGFWGERCDQACPGVSKYTGLGTPCNGLGSCDVSTGQCSCPPCYELASDGSCKPKTCPSCANGGACECDLATGDMKCACLGQFSGDSCQSCNCEEGECNPISGQCDCDAGFVGTLCDFECSRSSLCHGHGNCDASSGACECDEYYVGDKQHQCQFYCPPGKCSGHGFCSKSTGECVCQLGYGGSDCQPICDTDPCNGQTCTVDLSDSKGSHARVTLDGVADFVTKTLMNAARNHTNVTIRVTTLKEATPAAATAATHLRQTDSRATM